MSKHGALDKYTRNEAEGFTFDEESALARVALALANVLDARGVTQRELAQRIGVTEGRVSQILGADSNPTVRTLARIGTAVGCEFSVTYSPPPLQRRHAEPWPSMLRLIPCEWEPAAHDTNDTADDSDDRTGADLVAA